MLGSKMKNKLAELARRLWALFRHGQFEADLEEEMRLHQELREQEEVDRGVPPEEAHYAAQRRFGNKLVLREESHDMWGWSWFETLLHDARYGLRQLRRSPGFTAVAVLTLALGIGGNTGVFSVLNTLLLESLPFHQPDRLALLQRFIPPHGSAKEFKDWRQHSAYLADTALFEDVDVNLGGARGVDRARVAQTSWNFFPVLGTQLLLGHGFDPGDEVDGTGWGLPGRNAVAVISYALWQQLFGGNPRVLGATIRADGIPLTVIGVAPPGFDYPDHSVLWKPAAYSPGNAGWQTVARLKPGISWTQARAAFAVDVERRLSKPQRAELRPQIVSLQNGLLGPGKSASLMLMGAVGLILLIACTNVANLLTARAAGRAAELSMRSVLGASRARLARQLLTECLLLSFVATLAGLLVAYWTISLATKVEPPPLGVQSYSILNGHVMGFALIVSVFSAVLFGLLPLLQVGRIRALGVREPRTTRGSRLIHKTLIVAQVMFTMILLSASVLVGRTFAHLIQIDRGYTVRRIVTASVSLDGTSRQRDKLQLPYFEEVLGRIRRLPGVRSASATDFLPLDATGFVGGLYGLAGRPALRGSMMVPVFSDYFRTMGGRILYGRGFTGAELRSGAKVAVVTEGFAAAFGPAAGAVGQQLTMGRAHHWEIVGVVKRMDYQTDPTVAKEFQVFIPATTPGGFFSWTFVARVDGRAEDHLAEIRDAIRSVDPEVPVFNVKTVQQRLDELFIRPRFYRDAVWIFGGFALLLIAIGIYGLLAYTVARRTNEIGIRMTLGATQSSVARMVVEDALLMVSMGMAGGVPLAFSVKRLAASLMGGPTGSIAAPIGFGVLAIFVVALLATYIPARRAAKVDPMVALRYE
jgi:putative ABC transport system permease protein